MITHAKKEILHQLKQEILRLEGYRQKTVGATGQMGLGLVEDAFPNGVFPLGTIHEFVCDNTAQAASTGGFITGLLSNLMRKNGACLWVGLSQTLYPPSLKIFGIEPDKVIFLNVLYDSQVLWAMEEALKCTGLEVVIGEVSALSFKQSRRLQLAVEQSHVTGFVMRNATKKIGFTACAARWQIRPVPSEPIDGLPGLGMPRWQVDLLKVRNGKPGQWVLEWDDGKFKVLSSTEATTIERMRQYG